MSVDDLVNQGIAAAKARQRERARDLLIQAVEQDQFNEKAWIWLSSVVDSDEDRLICLENVLEINPDNDLARRGLEHLQITVKVQAQPEPAPAAPGPPPPSAPSSTFTQPSPAAAPDGPPSLSTKSRRRTFKTLVSMLGFMLLLATLALAYYFLPPEWGAEINEKIGFPLFSIVSESKWQLGGSGHIGLKAASQSSKSSSSERFWVAGDEVIEIKYKANVKLGSARIRIRRYSLNPLDRDFSEDTIWSISVKANEEHAYRITVPKSDHYRVSVSLHLFQGQVNVDWGVKSE